MLGQRYNHFLLLNIIEVACNLGALTAIMESWGRASTGMKVASKKAEENNKKRLGSW